MEFRFLEVDGGKVHVMPDVDENAPVVLRRLGEGPIDPIAHLMGDVRTRCGTTVSRHAGGMEKHARYVATFEDDRLCAKCYRSVPEEHRGELFTHPQEFAPA